MSDLAYRGSAFIGSRHEEPRQRQEIVQGLDLDELDEEHVKNVIRQELDSALGKDGGQLSTDRLTALRFYHGEPETGGELVPDRSQVVMRQVLEAVEWVLPALIRIFTASDKICLIEPPPPQQDPARPPMSVQQQMAEAEAMAKDATEYVNHIFYKDNEGFLLIHDWFKDALLEKLGWVKYYWDTQKRTETKSYTGLTQEQYDAILGSDDEVEVVKLTKYTQKEDSFNRDRPFVPPPPPGMPAPQISGPPGGVPGMAGPPSPGGPGPTPAPPMPPLGLAGPSPGIVPPPMMAPPLPPPPVELYDCTLRITSETRQVKIVNVPPEEILFSRRAKRGDVPFMSHRRRWTYSGLISEGYDEECLDLIPWDDSQEYNQERVERHREDGDWPNSPRPKGDPGSEIWVEENYAYFNVEEGGKTVELYKVMTAGNGLIILTKDGKPDVECFDEMPFVSICPIPSSHKLVGQSLADLTMDLQLIKSTLIRQMIDNAFLSNWPRIEVADDGVNENTYDDLLTLRPGGVVRTRRLGSIQPMMIPFTADKSFPLVEYLDQTQEVRTGVARHNQGINPDDLNKTATGVSLLQQAAAQRVELFARIFAHGVEQLLRGVMRLVRKHQQSERIIRVTGGWLNVDPRQWRQDMPVTVSVGLGTGNRDQILQHLMQIVQLQGTIVQQQQGVNGPLVYAHNVYDALQALQENAGFKSSFFTDPSKPPPPQAGPPPPPPKPDPEMMKAQASIQAEQMKAQANSQAIVIKAQAAEKLLNEKAQMDALIQQQKLNHEKDMAAMKANFEVELERTRAEHELAVGMARVKIEGEAKLKEIELKFAAGAYDQTPRVPNGQGGPLG